jgi:hypothetical protein
MNILDKWKSIDYTLGHRNLNDCAVLGTLPSSPTEWSSVVVCGVSSWLPMQVF